MMHCVEEEAYLKAQAEFRDFEREFRHVETLASNWSKYKHDRHDVWGKVGAYLDMLAPDVDIMEDAFLSSSPGTGIISGFDDLLEAANSAESSVSILKAYLDRLPLGERSEDTVVVAFHLTIMMKDLERMKTRLRYPYITAIEGRAMIPNLDLATRCANAAGAVEKLRAYISKAELKPDRTATALSKEVDELAAHIDIVIFVASMVKR